MARALTNDQKALLRSADLQMNVLMTFYLDEGTYYFCDEQGYDLKLGGQTYIGANALTEAAEIRASQDLQAESVTLVLDGNRMEQYGIADPAKVLKEILGYLYQQRRVDYYLGFRYSYSQDINLAVPTYAGKINSVRLIDNEIGGPGDGSARTTTSLEIVLDSLASRYRKASNRTRSHEDQMEIDPTDMFYSHTVGIVENEKNVFWGKFSPLGVATNIGNTGNYRPATSGSSASWNGR